MAGKRSESEIEKYLRERIEGIGGICDKWVSPGKNGVPDRIVFAPGGHVVFVETKREKGGVISPLQTYRASQLKALGQHVYFIHTKEQVDKLVWCLQKGVLPSGI